MVADITDHVTLRISRHSRLGEIFVAACSYDHREIPKDAGFRWEKDCRYWYTTDPTIALKLADAADPACKLTLAALAEAKAEAKRASAATSADIAVPCPDGLSYLPYQLAGIAALSQHPNMLLADEMGLGKTVQAIGLLNLTPEIHTALIICPASLKINWAREIQRWSTRDLPVEIADSKRWPSTPIVIANFDILHKHKPAIQARTWGALIIDEAHLIKNPKSQRSIMVYGGEGKGNLDPIRATRKVFLTGTPIANRPSELWPLIHALDPAAWDNFWHFAKRYCDAKQDRFGWDFSGASNLDELQERLRSSIMIRRLKKDVLAELPPKRRQVIEIPATGAAAAAVRAEAEVGERVKARLAALRAAAAAAKKTARKSDYAEAVGKLKAEACAAFSEMSKLRRATALAKIPDVIEHLKGLLEEGIPKVVVFAHHHEVVNALVAEFGSSCASLTGEHSLERRQAAVDRFQSDPKCRLFIGSITAAGVGITLTASSHVVFAELDWVPGNIIQAEDRTHRIGQANSVLIQHLVLEQSLDAGIARTLVAKQAVIDAALNGEAKAELLDEPIL